MGRKVAQNIAEDILYLYHRLHYSMRLTIDAVNTRHKKQIRRNLTTLDGLHIIDPQEWRLKEGGSLIDIVAKEIAGCKHFYDFTVQVEKERPENAIDALNNRKAIDYFIDEIEKNVMRYNHKTPPRNQVDTAIFAKNLTQYLTENKISYTQCAKDMGEKLATFPNKNVATSRKSVTRYAIGERQPSQTQIKFFYHTYSDLPQ